eukprot:TRINITY_DN2625_c3_g1_i1.p1 TRINITY_DN2625_c3_g1~~TRINITY_DN2625_c3_g1_i1.p1  ORF type:complete len:563 (-),score=83.42 TRINITY_DN2625_c3_g1_i1:165-1778(-)
MGASSSTAQTSGEQQELESLAVSMGALKMLQNAFSKLSDPQTNTIPLKSLKDCFCLNISNSRSEANLLPDCFPKLLIHLGPAIVDLFLSADEGVHWIEFLRGYIRCCGRTAASTSLNTLYKLYAAMCAKADIPLKLEFEADDSDSKISGYLMSSDVLMLLLMCWLMAQSSRILKLPKDRATVFLPDINNLVLSALVSCSEVGNDFYPLDCNISGLKNHISAQKLHIWALTTVPGLAYCFTHYVHDRLQMCATSEDKLDPLVLSVSDSTSREVHNTQLLKCGKAWAISLSLRGSLSEEISRACFPSDGIGALEKPLYRSSFQGKGLNRFWSNVEGYHGPLLILISASSEDAPDSGNNIRRWVIGALTQQGFENRDTFYGSSGYLYAISPIFHVFSPIGKDKNFVYSHLHPTGRLYEPHPKPVGIAFGGTVGNERIFIDEDFARVTVRHHAFDKTYQPGSLVPNQGFLAIEAAILDIEVWGFGGKTAKEDQGAYKKREQLFSEQRRTVDLKTFGNWEDSPEKMMMDMVSDPNRVQREDR